MGEWIDTDERMPQQDGYYLVACKGGNVTVSFYIADRVQAKKHFQEMNKGGSYSRKDQGNASAHFEITHRYGYKIEYWMDMPKYPAI